MVSRRSAGPAPKAASLADLIQFKRFDEIKADPRNARTHTDPQIALIEASLERSGWYAPLVEGRGKLRIGHGRLEAAKRLFMRGVHIAGAPPGEAPVVDRSDLDEKTLSALSLADNRISDLAGWDASLLAEQIGTLTEAGFDITDIGFSPDDFITLTSETDVASIVETPVSRVEDRFWISVRGPMTQQAAALQALRGVMEGIEGLQVELGTVLDDGPA